MVAVNAAAPGGTPAVTSLYVADLDANVTDSQLRDLFSRIGDVVSVKVCRNLSSGLSLGYGYVNYANPQYAQRALEELNFTTLNGKPIKIMCSHKEPRISQSDAGNIYIRNLEKRIDQKALHEIFSPFGNIISCKVAKDASGQSIGYGFVQFAGKDSTQKAIAELNGMLLNGKQVYVGSYLTKQERELFVDKSNFTNVFIKNLCDSTTEDDLKNIFGEFGLITSSVVKRNDDGTSKCFGFVNFANSKDASQAVESLNDQIFNKKKWYVGRAQKKFERQLEMKHHLESVRKAFDKGSNLYVKNLDDSIGDEKLKELFSPFGSVTSCGVIRDEKGTSIGRGLVAFSSPEEASRALSEMNGKIIGNKPLNVALALRKEDRRSCLQPQNLEKEIDLEVDHKALTETFSSSCSVSTDAPGQSMGYGSVQFSGVESAQKAIGELDAIVGKLNGAIAELNGIIVELNDKILNVKQVNGGRFLNKQENKLLAYKASFTNVFVENFCALTTEDDLKNIFGEFGLITSTVVMRNEDGTSKCFGFVNFENADDATRAVESLNGQIFDKEKGCRGRAQNKFERELELQKISKQSVNEAVDEGSNSYVKKLNDSVDGGKLSELFSPFRSVTSCKVMQDQKGISRGRGFVVSSPPKDAFRALSNLNGETLVSKPLNVALAQRQKDIRARLQPGFGYQELLAPRMRPAGPLMPCMFVPLVQPQQRGSCPADRPTHAGPKQKGPQPAPAISKQMIPRRHGPPRGMLSVQYEIGCLPLCDAGMSQPIPVRPWASSLANASSMNIGRCLVKFCTRLLNNWSLRQQLR